MILQIEFEPSALNNGKRLPLSLHAEVCNSPNYSEFFGEVFL